MCLIWSNPMLKLFNSKKRKKSLHAMHTTNWKICFPLVIGEVQKWLLIRFMYDWQGLWAGVRFQWSACVCLKYRATLTDLYDQTQCRCWHLTLNTWRTLGEEVGFGGGGMMVWGSTVSRLSMTRFLTVERSLKNLFVRWRPSRTWNHTDNI